MCGVSGQHAKIYLGGMLLDSELSSIYLDEMRIYE